ncbi:hypothetical protein GA0115240_16317 [Streptomyces sp. DvalAA-14]|uniref:hypothetical protein n=1 Tax=unclassified Streptomyces TaxID=2593676 RepID=UPI00081B6A53|nr:MULTISPECIES: hypothetical protein [unclassified Streptomyces]MYS24294.1 hypothetical protein [Streptomyces sp. SID4948]SCE44718.1 hypothetical protein GA0115240_16317 [Streptomyces sp. DvalAA-14]
MSFDERKSTPNWAEIDYDRSAWFPIPLGFEGTKWSDAAEWAFDYAGDRFVKGGRELTKKVVKKEVLPFAEHLVLARTAVAGRMAGHKLYCHCPDYTKFPVPAAVGLWRCQGTWEEAMRYYAYWGTESATTEAATEWFETEALGTGVKSRWSGVYGPGPYDQVNYIFRDAAMETDVHVFLTSWNHDRFIEILPDLDQLVRGIRCVPDPGT